MYSASALSAGRQYSSANSSRASATSDSTAPRESPLADDLHVLPALAHVHGQRDHLGTGLF